MTGSSNGKLGPALAALADRAADRAVTMLAASIEGRLGQLETDMLELHELVATRRSRRHAPAPIRDSLRPQILAALSTESRSADTIERAVGRPVKDRSTRRVLVELARAGVVERGDRGWSLARADGRCPACRRSVES